MDHAASPADPVVARQPRASDEYRAQPMAISYSVRRRSDVEPSLESSAEEVTRLRDCLNDLVRIMALPALRAGGEPVQIVGTLLDALLEMRRLAFVFVRLNDPEGGSAIELVRSAEAWAGTARARDIGAALDAALGETPRTWPPRARVTIRNVDLSVAAARLGLQGEIGVVVAASPGIEFPGQTERLLLDVAANQAAIGLQQARLLREQTRRANESERESRLIVDSIPGLVALLTATGDVAVVNPQLLEYFGQTLEELRQWGTNGTVHPEDLPHVVDVFSRSIASGSAYEIVQRFRRSDGVYRWFENRGFPLRDTNGNIVRWCVLLTDIDERKRAEDGLKRSERDLQLIIDTIPALAWSARPDGFAEFFNQHYLDYVGLSAEQARAWGWTAAVHPDDFDSVAAAWQRIMVSEEPGETEARLRRQDGTYRWFLLRANPLRDDSGTIVAWYGTNTDIDDRKRAEEALRRSEAFLLEGQHLARMGNFSWRVATDEITWSEQLYRIFAFEPGIPVTLQWIATRVHPDDIGLMQDMVERARRGVSDFEYEHRLLMPDLSVKHLHLIAHGTRDEQGRLEYIGAVQDVTQRRSSEEALSQARAELAHVARVMSLGTLTASIAHEVNQPLSGIITNASTCLRMLAADPPDVDGARETARRTIRDGNRAAEVIARLRALFSRKAFTPEPLDLSEVTREVIALSLSDLQRHRIILQSELADDLPSITGDRVQLQQVILNLLRNAADAMAGVHDRTRQLLIRTGCEDGNRVRLTVRDAGVGLDRQSMDKLFDAFYTTKSGGMGIGLSISRSIVERHHGRLWAEPNDGPGATFSLSIPSRPERVTNDDLPVTRNP
jgi:PAS domain S-box-containing protein